MWVMSILRLTEPTRYEVYIGAVKVALIYFGRSASRSCCYLDVDGEEETEFPTMSDALRELHRLLNSPSPEGAKVGGRAGSQPGEGAGIVSADVGGTDATRQGHERGERGPQGEGPPQEPSPPPEEEGRLVGAEATRAKGPVRVRVPKHGEGE
jgi:hypothetical protein